MAEEQRNNIKTTIEENPKPTDKQEDKDKKQETDKKDTSTQATQVAKQATQ